MLMSDILTDVTSVFTSAIGWLGKVGNTVVSTPILLIFVIVPLVGLGVGLFKRLLKV